MPVVHLADTSNDGCEGTHDRHELGQGDGLTAVTLEELRGAVHVLLLEQARVGLVEDRGSRLAANEVAGLVAGHGRQPHEGGRHPDVDADVAGAHEHSQGEQQRVSGQEEADEKAGLGEDDEHDAKDGPGAEPLDDCRDEVGGVEPLGAEHRCVD